MALPDLDGRTAGFALVIGYLGLIAILYRDPSAGIENSTANVQSALYFIVFPVLGIVSGVYAIREGPFAGIGVFLAASYLGILGLTLTLGGVASLPFVALGVVLFALAALALVISVKESVSYFGFDLDT